MLDAATQEAITSTSPVRFTVKVEKVDKYRMISIGSIDSVCRGFFYGTSFIREIDWEFSRYVKLDFHEMQRVNMTWNINFACS